MLRSARQLHGFAIGATDGPVGAIDDFYFDDQHWTVRYVVVDTGKWIPGRRVLLSPGLFDRVDWSASIVTVPISRQQVKDSPDIDTHKPVSRQHELTHLQYYGLPLYWTGPDLWGASPYPMRLTSEAQAELAQEIERQQTRAVAKGDTHLRSAREVTGYRLDASDGELGRVDDFLFDETSWTIRYLVVSTSQWWFGRKVLIPPAWATAVNWDEQAVTVRVSREQVKHAPPYDTAAHLDRQWEADYHRHYGVDPYWDRDIPAPPQ